MKFDLFLSIVFFALAIANVLIQAPVAWWSNATILVALGFAHLRFYIVND